MPAMAALAAMFPRIFKRHDSSDDEEEWCEVQDELEATAGGHRHISFAADKCLELHTANQALAQRIAALELNAASRDEATAKVVRAAVRDELASFAAGLKPLLMRLCMEDTKTNALASSVALLERIAASRISGAPLLDPQDERVCMLALGNDDLHTLNINTSCVCAHELRAVPGGKNVQVPLVSPRRGAMKGHISFLNLRPTDIDVFWVDYDGAEQVVTAGSPSVRGASASNVVWLVFVAAD